RVGGRGLELLPDGLGRVEEGNGVAEALRHLGLAVESEDALRGRQQCLRLGEREAIREPRVPAARDLPHQLEMLELVFTHRHEGWMPEKTRAMGSQPTTPEVGAARCENSKT